MAETKGGKPLATLTFRFDRETKNTVRYNESVAQGAAEVVGTLYVHKTALPEPYPTTLTATIIAA